MEEVMLRSPSQDVVIPAKSNGNAEIAAASAHVADARIAEIMDDPQAKRIQQLEAQVKELEMGKLLEERNALVGWSVANNLRLQQVETKLLSMGWNPAMQGSMPA